MAGGLSVFFGFLIPWIWHRPIKPGVFVAALVFLLLAWVYPLALKYIYILWMKVGGVLGWVNSRIILSLVFFLIIFLVGVLRRAFSTEDTMKRKLEKNTASYRITRENHALVSQMEKPY